MTGRFSTMYYDIGTFVRVVNYFFSFRLPRNNGIKSITHNLEPGRFVYLTNCNYILLSTYLQSFDDGCYLRQYTKRRRTSSAYRIWTF